MKRGGRWFGRKRPTPAEVEFAHKLYQKEKEMSSENSVGESVHQVDTSTGEILEEPEVRTYRDVVEERGLEPPIIPIADVADKELIILEVRPAQTQFGEALYVKVKVEEELWAFFTSGVVLGRKLMEVLDALPLRATIIRVKRYYDLM